MKKTVVIFLNQERDRNFRYARQEGLAGKTVRPFLIDDRLQPEEIPEIHGKTNEKWGGIACFIIFYKKQVPRT